MGASHPSSGSRDLEDLVVDTLARIDREGRGALDAACAMHPEHADALRRRIATLGDLGLLAPTDSSAPPRRLGDFELIDRIGVGGMGVVYHAVQTSLGRDVALKIIRPEMLYMPGARERFARETTIIARLQHPGIVPIHTVGGADELPYYAMERVPGCTLAEALIELGRESSAGLAGVDLARAVRARSRERGEAGVADSSLFTGTWEQTCLRIVRQVAEALEHAHGRGVLHRDVKPSNIMITPGGRVMLVDFGLSSDQASDVTRTGERVGSLPYMSPELLQQGTRAADARSDVYSLGVTLYQLLTLHLPFAGDNALAQHAAILEGRPPRPRALIPELSWEAETVALVAIERDPKRRYATAADFARDLGNALEHEPVEARRASAWLRSRRWIEHHPGAAAALFLAALVPTVAAVYQLRETRRANVALADITRQQALTQANYDRAMRAVDAMLRRVGMSSLDNVPGLDAVRADLLGEAGELYAEARRERPLDERPFLLGGECELLRAGSLHRLGRDAEAEPVVRSVLERVAPLLQDGAGFELRAMEARAEALLGEICTDAREAADHRARALAAYSKLNVERPQDASVRRNLVESQVSTLLAIRAAGQRTNSVVDLGAMVTMARAVLADEPSTDSKRRLARVLAMCGWWKGIEGGHEGARPFFEEALALRTSALADDPRDDDTRADVVETASNLAIGWITQKQHEKGLALLDMALPEASRNVAEYPDVVRYRTKLADVELNRGVAFAGLGRKEEERQSLEHAAAVQAEILAREPQVADHHRLLGTILLNLVSGQHGRHEFELALETCDRARASIEHAVELEPSNRDIASWQALERHSRAGVLLALERIAEAAEALADAPKLAAHRPDRVSGCLKSMVKCLERARAGGETDVVARCQAAATRARDLATERGDLEKDPSLARLRVMLREP